MPSEDYINFDYTDWVKDRRDKAMKPEELEGEWETQNGSKVSITKFLCNNELVVGHITTLTVGEVTIKNLNLVSLWGKDANHYSDPGLNLTKRIRQTRKNTIG